MHEGSDQQRRADDGGQGAPGEGMDLPEVVLPPEPVRPLAKTIARRTTDLIAISLILVGLVTVSRRILEWWQAEPAAGLRAELSHDAMAPWNLGEVPTRIDFGDAPFSLERSVVRGNLDDAREELQRWCRELLLQTPAPKLPEASDAEVELLSHLERREPVEQGPGWAIRHMPGVLTMTVGTREIAGGNLRVVCWGITFPLSEGAWTLLLVTPHSGGGAGAGRTLTDVPLPDSARRVVALSNRVGGRLVTFAGGGELSAWRAHFDRLGGERNWTVVREWHQQGAMWSGVWETGGEDRQRIDVQFSRVDDAWTGLVNVMPITTGDDQP